MTSLWKSLVACIHRFNEHKFKVFFHLFPRWLKTFLYKKHIDYYIKQLNPPSQILLYSSRINFQGSPKSCWYTLCTTHVLPLNLVVICAIFTRYQAIRKRERRQMRERKVLDSARSSFWHSCLSLQLFTFTNHKRSWIAERRTCPSHLMKTESRRSFSGQRCDYWSSFQVIFYR